MYLRRASAAALVAAGLLVSAPVVTACNQGVGSGGELEDDSPQAPGDSDDELGGIEDEPTDGPTETVGIDPDAGDDDSED